MKRVEKKEEDLQRNQTKKGKIRKFFWKIIKMEEINFGTKT